MGEAAEWFWYTKSHRLQNSDPNNPSPYNLSIVSSSIYQDSYKCHVKKIAQEREERKRKSRRRKRWWKRATFHLLFLSDSPLSPCRCLGGSFNGRRSFLFPSLDLVSSPSFKKRILSSHSFPFPSKPILIFSHISTQDIFFSSSQYLWIDLGIGIFVGISWMMEVRRRTTLLDQMAIMHSSSNLRDLLRLRGEEDRRQEQTLTTLGSVLFGDKQDPLSSSPALRPVLHCRNGDRKKPISSTAAATAVSRTLLDVMREEEAAVAAVATEMEEFTSVASSSNSNNNSKINWKSFKDRLGLRRPNSAACSSVSAAGTTNPPADQTSDTSPAVSEVPASAPPPAAEEFAPASASTASEPVRMDLASALAAERRLRPGVIVEAAPATPARMSLMSLLEETERAASEAGGEEKKVGDGVGGGEYVCCVCMVRRKGAAFIPCGHTFCRACSRELWVARGDCPLCNAHILEVLDIF